MCLMLYMATASEQPCWSSPDLRVEALEPAREAVRRHFTLPQVRVIGSHSGCGCGFPAVIAEQPIDYFDGMLDGAPDRAADLLSVRALLDLLRALTARGAVELYPVGDGEEAAPAKGALEREMADLDATTFFFNERFLYCIVNKS
jgi:hypothetical protein